MRVLRHAVLLFAALPMPVTAGWIEGKVVDPEGAPVATATVLIYGETSQSLKTAGD